MFFRIKEGHNLAIRYLSNNILNASSLFSLPSPFFKRGPKVYFPKKEFLNNLKIRIFEK
jgi:hypothetical protein